MPNGSGRTLAVAGDDDSDERDDQDLAHGELVDGARHVLVLGEEEFVCKDVMPFGTLIRYADNDLLGIHHILVKVVIPDSPSEAELAFNPDAQPSFERMWDAFEELDQDEVMKAIKDLIRSYTDRPTKSPSSSRGGRRGRSTGRR